MLPDVADTVPIFAQAAQALEASMATPGIGERLRKLNQANAEGNFYLKPNGVFFGDAAGNWRVLSSEDFAAFIRNEIARSGKTIKEANIKFE